MSAEDGQTPTAEPTEARSRFGFRYGDASRVTDEGERARLALFAELGRDPVRLDATLRDPVAAREALSAVREVVASDLRYTPKDRTQYLAWKRLQEQTAGQAAWQAQQAYFDWLSRNDPLAWFVLDPVVTVHPDGVLFEVFSKDEGAYAALTLGRDAFDAIGEPVCGTTHIDFSDALFDGIQRMRSYRSTAVSIGAEAVAVTTEGASVIEKQINVPDAWLRGFLQVQSAGTLVRTRATFAPIDLYNALRHLRLNADQKKQGRALRVEMVPGEQPRLVLEPWETIIEGSADAYAGDRAQVIRIWGRRRLMLIQRFLPFTESVEVHTIGSGLPSFWVLRGRAMTLTLGLTGFTASNWSQALLFDILLPRPDGDDPAMKAALDHLKSCWHDTADGIADAIGQPIAEARRALQSACQRGLVMYDLAVGRYRLRPLLGEAIDPAKLAHRSPDERAAHDLLEAGAVRVESRNEIPTVGTEVVGQVELEADKREFRPTMLIDDEGRVRKADCTCAAIRKNGLRRGPCAHLIGLRLKLAADRRAEAAGGRATIEVATKTFTRRRGPRETVYQVSLDRARLKVRWGDRGETPRVQSLWFDSTADARAAFFERIDALAAGGYLDATAE